MTEKTKTEVIHALGKRKKAIARAYVKEGSGKVKINNVPIDLIEPRYRRLRIKEPLILAKSLKKDFLDKIDIIVNVKGGGSWGQADACRTAIANALIKKDEDLKEWFIEYDRSLLISDPRRTEPHKPSRSSAGPRRKKQQSKR